MKKAALFLLLAVYCNTSFAQTITTIAGTGVTGYTGDGGAATAAQLNAPADIVFDRAGNLYFSDFYNNVIRKIDRAGMVSTIAGTGAESFSGDGGPATAATLNHPCGLLFNSHGELMISDQGNEIIRLVDTSGNISTIIGTPTIASYGGDGGPATAAMFDNPTRMAYDHFGNLYISDYHNQRIRKVDVSGIVTTYAGTGYPGFSGDGGPAILAEIFQPTDVAFDGDGNLYITDQLNNRIRKVDAASGKISTVVGVGTTGYSGDGGPATAAELYYPSTVTFDALGNMYIDDAYNDAIREVSPSGVISTAVGNGTSGFTGDGGAATSATLNQPWEITVDACGNLYIADAFNDAIRKVTFNSIIPPITGASTVRTGSSITLADAATGGTWSVAPATVATIDSATGIVTGVSPGTAVVTFSGDCGVTADTITVYFSESSTGVTNLTNQGNIALYPNPNNGTFSISCVLKQQAKEAELKIADVLGRIVYSSTIAVNNGSVTEKLTLDNSIAAGVYFMKISTGTESNVLRFVIDK
jgi:sugar lactone lactonase YvrE